MINLIEYGGLKWYVPWLFIGKVNHMIPFVGKDKFVEKVHLQIVKFSYSRHYFDSKKDSDFYLGKWAIRGFWQHQEISDETTSFVTLK